MSDYTVTISGTEREDGEKPYTYVVSARNPGEAVEMAMFHHGPRPDLKVEEVVAGIPADDCGFHWNDRREGELMAKKISLGWPDSQTVTVFLDGKHVATMTNAPGYEGGIPVEIFDLMRAAPDLLAALKQCRKALLHICHNCPAFEDDAPEFNEGGIGYEACSVSIEAINKAEGRVA